MNVGTKSGETFEKPDEPFEKPAETGLALHTVAQTYTYVCIGLRVYTCKPYEDVRAEACFLSA